MKNKFYFLLIFLIFFTFFLFADGSDSAETTIKPWAGWWWPIKEGGLATGIVRRNGEVVDDWYGYPSPMQRYDMLENSNGKGPAFLWEYENHYDPEALDWHGHCDAWAAASVVESEPTETGEEKGVYFRIGDKKGLLTECHVGDVATIYGTRYNDFPGDDKDDIYPDLFHEKLIEYIKNRDEPLIIENDPGVEVWNYPCFKYEMHWSDDGNIRHVTTTVYLVTDAVNPDYVGCSYYPFTYTYDLQLDDGGNIIGGHWTGNSVNYHPDFVWEVDSVHPGNPNLDYDEVKRIASLGLEGNLEDDLFAGNNSFQSAAEIKPGIFLLRYLNDDYFKIACEEGENFLIKLNSKRIERNLRLEIYDESLNIIKSIDTDGNYSATLETGPLNVNGYFYIVIKGTNPQENRRNYLLEVENNSKVYYLPHIAAKDGWRTHLLLLNREDREVNIAFHFYQNFNTVVLHRQFEPHSITLEPEEVLEKDITELFQNFTPSNDRWLKIISDGEIEATAVFEYESGGNVATMDFMVKPELKLYFPHIASTDTWWTGIAIVNVGDVENDVKLIPYKSDGTEAGGEISLTLKGHERFVKLVKEIFSEDILNSLAYVKIEGEYPLVGYELFGTNDFTQFEGVTFEKNTFKNGYFTYTKSGEDWWNGISILNVSDGKATVRITPLNSDGMNVYGVLDPHVEEVVLQPGEKYVRLISSIFSGYTHGEIAYLKIESNYNLMGFTLSGSFDSGILYGDLLCGEEDVKKDYTFQVPFNLDKLQLFIGNYVENGNVKVDIDGYDESGTLLKKIENYQIDFRKLKVIDLGEIFGDLDVKVLKLSSDKNFFSTLIYVDENLNEATLIRGN